MVFLEQQLHFIRALQNGLRSPLLDAFFKGWNYVDTPILFLVLIPVVWISYSRRLGLQIFYGAMLSGLLNALLKNWFHLPRPFVLDPDLAVIHVSGFSFPSGAAQTAIWLSFLIALHFNNKVSFGLGILFTALLSFSRVYLGVHYPSDVLAGWLVGGSVLYFLHYSPGFTKIFSWGK